jgi:hypothetical protein
MDEVRASGPLFDGRAAAAIRDGVAAIRKRLAAEGEHLAGAVFASQIRDNHGRFAASLTVTGESRAYTTHSGHHSYTLPIAVTDPATDLAVTTDLATYGPWLEGVGSRNETTRFKGYHGFRLAGQQLSRTAGALADAEFRPYAARCE